MKAFESFEVDILVNNKPVKQFAHDGKVFIESKHSTEYTIRVKNNSWSRRMFVVSVDGINVVTGEAAGATPVGYIINGYSSYDIKGFRTSNDNVNAFKFSSKSKSYAAKSEQTDGDTSNCGAIGVEVYEEKEKPQPVVKYIPHVPYPSHPYRPYRWNDYILGDITWTATFGSSLGNSNATSCRSASNSEDGRLMACNATQSVNHFDMGTEFSNKEIADHVVNVNFEVGLLLETVTIYYASRYALTDLGVPLTKEVKVSFPEPFPSRFCKPPR